MNKVAGGQTWVHNVLKTKIYIEKPLEAGNWWVKGRLGGFKIREHSIRLNYKKESRA